MEGMIIAYPSKTLEGHGSYAEAMKKSCLSWVGRMFSLLGREMYAVARAEIDRSGIDFAGTDVKRITMILSSLSRLSTSFYVVVFRKVGVQYYMLKSLRTCHPILEISGCL